MGSAAENFDAWFKERLEQYEEAPKAAAWDNISEKLGHKRKKRLLVFIMRIAAGMILTLSLGLGYYYYTRQSKIIQPSITNIQQRQNQPAVNKTETITGKDNAMMHTTNEPASRLSNERHAVSAVQATYINMPAGQATTGMIPAGTSEKASGLLAFAGVPSRIRSISAIIANETLMTDMVVQLNNRTPDQLSETRLILQQNLAMMETAEGEQNDYKNWMVGGQFAPLYSYRNLNTVNSDYANSKDIKALNNTEKGVMAYAGGIAIAFAPSRRLSIQSGVYYSKYGQEKTDLEPVAYDRNEYFADNVPESNVQVTISNSTGIITAEAYGDEKTNTSNTMTQQGLKQWGVVNLPGNTAVADASQEPENLTAFQYFEYLEVPLTLRYKVIDRKLDFSLFGGVSTNFLAGNSVKISDNNNIYDFGETADIAKVNYSGSVGIGLEYPIITNLLINLEPKFRYYLNPIYKSGDLNVFPYSVGVFAGISYVF